MRKLPLILIVPAFVSSQGTSAGPVPSNLSGVIVMSCTTTDAGTKVDEDTYKIDLVKSQVNNEPAEIEISDISISWRQTVKEDDPYKNIAQYPSISINRNSGKLEYNAARKSRKLTICRVSDRRKF